MKRIILALALAFGTISCSSCAKKVPAPVVVDSGVTPIPPTPVPTTVTIRQDNWEFTLPSDGWTKVEEPPPNSVVFMNKDKKNIVLLVNEDFPGTLDEYALTAVRGLKAVAATIASTKQVDVNGHKFVLVESARDGARVWMWVTVLSSKGYGFSCGGEDNAEQHDRCFGIANTLKIN